MHAFYYDGLSYREVHNLKIVKGNFKKYVVNPKMGVEISEKTHISIRWCTHPHVATHFWGWYLTIHHTLIMRFPCTSLGSYGLCLNWV